MPAGRKPLSRLLPLLLVLLAGPTPGHATTTRYHSGSRIDAKPVLHGPAYNLGGGGRDVMEALQWMIDQVRGPQRDAKVDVVVLRASQADGYNQGILAMAGVNSVETLVITSAADANTPEVEATIRQAEVVFFAGGNQCHYVTYFKGTKVEAAVKSVVARGGAVGGTSAGCAIMGSLVFDACQSHLSKDQLANQALADPYAPEWSFTSGFFDWPPLANVITDTHFVPRNRMGRALAFLARLVKDHPAGPVLGVAVNERTSLTIDKTGLGRVWGTGPVYLIEADHPPEVCLPGQPLTYRDFKIWKLEPGMTFNFLQRPDAGFYRRSVIKGQLSGNPYTEEAPPSEGSR